MNYNDYKEYHINQIFNVSVFIILYACTYAYAKFNIYKSVIIHILCILKCNSASLTVPDNLFNIRHSLFQKTLTFLKIFLFIILSYYKTTFWKKIIFFTVGVTQTIRGMFRPRGAPQSTHQFLFIINVPIQINDSADNDNINKLI